MDPATSHETQEATDLAEVNALLGGPGVTEPPAADEVETGEPAATEGTVDTEAKDDETELATDESTDEADESAEAAEEETDDELSPTDSDREYSDAFYAKAAAKFSRNLKVQYDPQDPKDRATLRELVQRGEDFKALKAAAEAKAAEEAEAPAKTNPEAVDPRAAKTPQDIQANIKMVQEFAKTRVVPEVAKHISNRLVKALWPDQKGELPQEQANEIATAFTEMGVFLLQEMMPSIQGQTLGALAADPVYNRVTGMAVREAAFELLDTQKDSAGNSKYPDLERMVDRGEIQRAIKANDWINKMDFNEHDPIKREAKRIETAYKIARGEQVSPATVGKAVQTGKKQAELAARQRGAARVAPGKTKGELTNGPSEGTKFVNEMLTSSREGAFDRAASRKS